MGRVFCLGTTHRPRLRERGDTIVEVMISLIVISTILTGAFLVARTSSQNIRSSQEHSEALQLLQGQVEMLRARASTAGSGLASITGTFCMSADGQPVQASDAGFADSCEKQGSGQLYNFVIQKDTTYTDATMKQFIFMVNWDKLGGGSNHESLTYRLAVS